MQGFGDWLAACNMRVARQYGPQLQAAGVSHHSFGRDGKDLIQQFVEAGVPHTAAADIVFAAKEFFQKQIDRSGLPLGVFWDVSKVPMPEELTGDIVTRAVKKKLENFGVISVFNAYCEVGNSLLTPQQRSALQLSGCHLIDTPRFNNKDVADKMIIVDAMLFAMANFDHGGTICFITGDTDYAYLLSRLSELPQFRTVLVSNHVLQDVLHMAASSVFTWSTDILGGTPTAAISATEDVVPAGALKAQRQTEQLQRERQQQRPPVSPSRRGGGGGAPQASPHGGGNELFASNGGGGVGFALPLPKSVQQQKQHTEPQPRSPHPEAAGSSRGGPQAGENDNGSKPRPAAVGGAVEGTSPAAGLVAGGGNKKDATPAGAAQPPAASTTTAGGPSGQPRLPQQSSPKPASPPPPIAGTPTGGVPTGGAEDSPDVPFGGGGIAAHWTAPLPGATTAVPPVGPSSATTAPLARSKSRSSFSDLTQEEEMTESLSLVRHVLFELTSEGNPHPLRSLVGIRLKLKNPLRFATKEARATVLDRATDASTGFLGVEGQGGAQSLFLRPDFFAPHSPK